jgi:predicted PurR-regulated permease PerM
VPALYLTWQVRGVIRLVVIALFVALALNPLVDAIDARTRAPRAAVIVSLYLTLAGGVVSSASSWSRAWSSRSQLSHDAPRYAEDLRHNATFRSYDDRYHLTARLQSDARELPGRLARATGSLQAVTVKAFGVIGDLVTVLAVAFLLMLHGRRYVDMGLRLTGAREARYRKLVRDVNHAVAQYMLGRSRSASWRHSRRGWC